MDLLRSRASTAGRLAVAILICGIAAGLIGVAMAWILEGFEWLFYGVDASSLPERVAAAPAWRRALAPAAAGLIAGALWWWERATGGVMSVEQVVMDAASPTRAPSHYPSTARRMGLTRPFADAVLQVLTVGGGNSVGREGAPRLAAGAVAVKVCRALRLHAGWMGLLVASAAGAGLAAMYNAPLGGAAYAVEIVMVAGTRRRGVWLAVPVSAIATVVSWIHWRGPALEFPTAQLTWAGGVAAIAVAVLAGLAGWAARWLWGALKRHRVPDRWQLPLAIGAAGLLTGAASLWLPILPGNGRDAFQAALLAPTTLTALAAMIGVFALKPLLTGFTLAGGATGGLLAPSFSLGAAVGASVALAAELLGLEVSVPLMALVGAAVTLGVTQKAPIFAAIFIWELTHAPLYTLPFLLLACYAATRLSTHRK